MTALRKTQNDVETQGPSLFTGDHVELFSTSSAPTTSEMMNGDMTCLFSTSSAPTTSEMMNGDMTCQFSSGSAPLASADIEAGDGTHMFSSGS